MQDKLTLVRGAKQLLTLRGPNGMRRGNALSELTVIEDGSVLVRNGLIEQVGSTRRLENLRESRQAEELDATGLVVMPAFTDPAIQLPVAATNATKRKRHGDFSERALFLTRSCLQHGTLHGQVKIGFRDSGARPAFSLLKDFARIDKLAFRAAAMWYIDERPASAAAVRGDEIAAGVKRSFRSGLAHGIEVAPECDPVVRDKAWETAAAERIPVSLIWPGGSHATLSELLSRVRPRTIFCPSVIAKEEGSLLASVGLPLICSPAGSLPDLQAPSALPQWVEAGTPFALASGFREPDWPTFSMQGVIKLAVWKLGLTIEQAISAATVNAAWSIGAGLRTGTLEAGKNADLLLLQTDDYHELPRPFGANLVLVAMRAGRIVFDARKASST